MNLKPQVTLSETGCALLEGKTFDVPGLPSLAIPDGFLSDALAGAVAGQTLDATATLAIAQDANSDWDVNVSISATLPALFANDNVGPWGLSQKLPAALDGLLSDVKALGGSLNQTITAKLAWVSA